MISFDLLKRAWLNFEKCLWITLFKKVNVLTTDLTIKMAYLKNIYIFKSVIFSNNCNLTFWGKLFAFKYCFICLNNWTIKCFANEHSGKCLCFIFPPAVSQKEYDDLQRWKEENQPGAINLAPERLGNNTTTNKIWALNIDKRIIVLSAANVFFVKGGDVQLSEARQRQQMVAHQSKLQKKVLTSCLNKWSNDHLSFGVLYLTVMFLGFL